MFVLARLVLGFAARSAGYKHWLASTWMRWDSAHYLSVASRGYELFSCAQLPGYNAAEFCGNAAWLPGFPLLIRGFSRMGLTPEQSGVVIAAGFALAGLTLLWNAFLGPELSTRGLLALGLAALFPGHVYYYAVFPISMCTFFQIAAITLYISKRFLLAGLAGFIAAFSYSSGFFLAAVFGLHLLWWRRNKPPRDQARALIQVAGLTFAGFLAVVLLQRVQVGAWNAYRLVQAKYHYAFTLPWSAIKGQLYDALKNHSMLGWQAMFFGLLVALVLWAALRTPRKPLDSLLAIFALTYWLVPLMLGPGYVAVIRAESMLLPIVPLAHKLPTAVLASVVLILLLLAIVVSPMFFRGQLV